MGCSSCGKKRAVKKTASKKSTNVKVILKKK